MWGDGPIPFKEERLESLYRLPLEARELRAMMRLSEEEKTRRTLQQATGVLVVVGLPGDAFVPRIM